MAKVRVTQFLRFHECGLNRKALLELHRTCRAGGTNYVAGQPNSPSQLCLCFCAIVGNFENWVGSSAIARIGRRLVFSDISRSSLRVSFGSKGDTSLKSALGGKRTSGQLTCGRRWRSLCAHNP